MATANTSSAYKLHSYAPARKTNTKESLRVVRTPKQFLAEVVTPKTFCVFAIAVTVVCLMVYNQALLTEITAEMNDIDEQLLILKSENTRMTSILDSAVTVHSVTQAAEQELGLQRLDKFQTEYVYIYQEDTIERTEAAPEDSWSTKVRHTVNSAIDSLKEYIAKW